MGKKLDLSNHITYAPPWYKVSMRDQNELYTNICTKHGAYGYAVYHDITYRLNLKGYFLEITEFTYRVIAKDLFLKVKVVERIVKDLIDDGFFHKPIYKKFNILTNSFTQESYIAYLRHNRRINIKDNLNRYIHKDLIINVDFDNSYTENALSPHGDRTVAVGRIEENREEKNRIEEWKGIQHHLDFLKNENLTIDEKLSKIEELKSNPDIEVELYNELVEIEKALKLKKEEKNSEKKEESNLSEPASSEYLQFPEISEQINGQIWLDDVCCSKSFDQVEFKKFVHEWLETKRLTGDYHYSIQKLKLYLIIDYEKHLKSDMKNGNRKHKKSPETSSNGFGQP